MLRVLRFALMWLVALALPVQGVAAATMMFCGAQGSGSAAHEHAKHERVSHDHAAHGHQVSHDVGLAASDDGGGDAKQSTDVSDVGASCSVCASCCTTATLPAQPGLHGAPDGHPVYQDSAASSTATFVTSGLDRPPRPTLA